MPREAPVTRAVFPLSSDMANPSFLGGDLVPASKV
jgi:hypothetical protein